MIYLIVLLTILLGCYFYDYRRWPHGKLIYWILLMVMMICVAGFRYRMGIDSIKYENYYMWGQHGISQLKLSDFQDTRFAPFYVILSALCRTISKEFMILQFAVAIIVNCTFFWFIWKNTSHCFFGILLYYFFLYLNLNMEVLRESLAVSMFLLSWPFFRKGQWLYYYIMAFCAFMCHLSAMILFVLPLICMPGVKWCFRLGMQTWIIGLVFLAMAFVINTYLFDFIQMIAMSENMAERAEVYSKTDLGGSTLNLLGMIPRLIKYVLYPAIALSSVINMRRFKDEKLDKDGFEKLEMMTVLSIYLSLMTLGVTLLIRYNNYFLIFPIVIMSDWVFTSMSLMGKRIRMDFVKWIIVFMPLLGIQLYTTYYANFNKSGTLKYYMMFYPYSNQFDQKLEGNREKLIQYSRKF